MALVTRAKLSAFVLAAGLATVVSSGIAYAMSGEEPKASTPEVPQLILGDENSDAMPTGSIQKIDSGSCEKGSSNLKVPSLKKAHIPEETP